MRLSPVTLRIASIMEACRDSSPWQVQARQAQFDLACQVEPPSGQWVTTPAVLDLESVRFWSTRGK